MAEIHDRSAVLWDRIAAQGYSKDAQRNAATERAEAARYRDQQAHPPASPVPHPGDHLRSHNQRYPAATYGPMLLSPDPDDPDRQWCFQCPAWIRD